MGHHLILPPNSTFSPLFSSSTILTTVCAEHQELKKKHFYVISGWMDSKVRVLCPSTKAPPLSFKNRKKMRPFFFSVCCVVRNFLFKWAKGGLNVWWEKKWGNFEIRVAFFKLSIPIAVIKKEKKMKQKEVKEYKETHLPLISKRSMIMSELCALYIQPRLLDIGRKKKRKLGKSLWDC